MNRQSSICPSISHLDDSRILIRGLLGIKEEIHIEGETTKDKDLKNMWLDLGLGLKNSFKEVSEETIEKLIKHHKVEITVQLAS